MSRVTASRILQLDPEPSTALAAIYTTQDPLQTKLYRPTSPVFLLVMLM